MTIPVTGMSLADHAALVPALAAAGYTDAWTAEVAGTDAFTPLALASTWAPTLRLGTAIVPVFTRGPALIAMSAASLANAAPGRFVLGLGASSPIIVSDWNGLTFDAPWRRTRDVSADGSGGVGRRARSTASSTRSASGGSRWRRHRPSHPRSCLPDYGPRCCGWPGRKPTARS